MRNNAITRRIHCINMHRHRCRLSCVRAQPEAAAGVPESWGRVQLPPSTAPPGGCVHRQPLSLEPHHRAADRTCCCIVLLHHASNMLSTHLAAATGPDGGRPLTRHIAAGAVGGDGAGKHDSDVTDARSPNLPPVRPPVRPSAHSLMCACVHVRRRAPSQ